MVQYSAGGLLREPMGHGSLGFQGMQPASHHGLAAGPPQPGCLHGHFVPCSPTIVAETTDPVPALCISAPHFQTTGPCLLLSQQSL